MIVLRDNERLYLASWEYNAARIMTALARIFENHGGIVAPQHTAVISNRNAEKAISEYAERLQALRAALEKATEPERRERLQAAIRDYSEKLEEKQNAENGPITITHSYIVAALDGLYYSLFFDDNFLFPFHYRKTPIVNGKASRDAAAEELEKSWLYDCFITGSAAQADIIEAANLIFNILTAAPLSEIIRDKHRERVPNRYNNGYHYETIYTPERFEKLEFLTA